jgi:tripartite-type tricarboxylate transporter receptor subunit TctC
MDGDARTVVQFSPGGGMKQVLLAGLAALLPFCASAQSYPSKPIQIVSSASPGSSGDAAIRMMAVKMTESMGQPIVIELRTAARGGQAYQVMSKAAPDGHTLTFGTAGTFVYGRFLFKNMAFDILKDYAPVSLSLTSPSYVAVHNSVGVNTLKELIAYAKKNPGKLEYASTGMGSYFHLAGEAVKDAAGIFVLHIPYAQANFPQMVNDWSSGRVALWYPTFATLKPNIARVKTLAIIDRQRSKHLPDVPTVTEVLPGFQPFVVWWGFFGPVGLPTNIAARFAEESRKAMNHPDVAPKLDELGMTIVGSTPQEHATLLRQDIAVIGKLVKAIGLQPE